MSFTKDIVRIFLACSGSVLLAAFLSSWGLWIVSILTSFFFGFIALGVSMRMLDKNRDSSALAGVAGLLIVVTAGIMSVPKTERMLWSGTVSGISVQEAGNHRWASAFEFGDGLVRPKWEGSSRNGNRSYFPKVYVVPVVAGEWTPDQPIVVWAVARDDNYRERYRLWQKPIRIGVVVSGFYVSDYRDAVRDACVIHNLRPDFDPIFVEWTPDPETSLINTWRNLGNIIAIASTMLISVIAAVYIFQRIGGRPPR